MSCRNDIKLLDKARERAVWIALSANVSMAVVKLVSAHYSSSRVLTSEGLHSVADIVNSVMLLIGLWSARKPADDTHPYGYGKDSYFWSFMAAVFMLGVISTGSMALGYERIINPSDTLDLRIALAGLGIAIIVESIAVSFAVYALLAGATITLKRKAGIMDLGRAFRETDNPTAKLVFVEDLMALIGAIIAIVFIWLAGYSGSSFYDGIGAIIIGVMLGILALLIAIENRDKLIGESASETITKDIERAAMNCPPVRGIAELKTMVIGPNQILVNLTVELDPDLDIEEMDALTAELERNICKAVPQVKELFIEVIADRDDMGDFDETAGAKKRGGGKGGVVTVDVDPAIKPIKKKAAGKEKEGARVKKSKTGK